MSYNHETCFQIRGIKFCPDDYDASGVFRNSINNILDGFEWFVDKDGDNLVDVEELRREGENGVVVYEIDAGLKNKVDSAYIKYFENYLDTVNKYYSESETKEIYPVDLLESLPPLYKELVFKYNKEIQPLVNELYLLYLNPNLPKTRQVFLEQFNKDPLLDGNEENLMLHGARVLTSHIISGRCPGRQNDNSCSLYPVPPDIPEISSLVSNDIAYDEWILITKAFSKDSPVLRPDTVVRWKNGKPEGVLNELRGTLSDIEKGEERLKLLQKQFENEKLTVIERKELVGKKKLLDGMQKEAHRQLEGCLLELKEKLQIIPMPLYPVYADISAKLAVKCREFANYKFREVDASGNVKLTPLRDINPSLVRQFEATAKYLEAGDLASATELMQTAMAQDEGTVKFDIYPFGTETYERQNTKFDPRSGVYARDTTGLKARMKPYETYMLKPSDDLAIEKTAYDGEGEKGDAEIEIVNVIAWAGSFFAELNGTVGGWNLPNYIHFGENKEIVIVKNVFELLKEERAEYIKMLLKKLNKTYTIFGECLAVAIHEKGHFVGPTRNCEVAVGRYKGATMGSIFDKYWGWADELKADQNIASVLKRILLDTDVDTEEGRKVFRDVQEAFTTYLNWGIKAGFRPNDIYKADEGHFVGWLVENGWWFEHGLYAMKDGEFVINISDPDKITKEELLKWLELGEELFLKTIDYQARGDLDGFLTFADKTARFAPGAFQEFVQNARAKTGVKRNYKVFKLFDLTI